LASCLWTDLAESARHDRTWQKAAEGCTQSKTLREELERSNVRQVLECASRLVGTAFPHHRPQSRYPHTFRDVRSAGLSLTPRVSGVCEPAWILLAVLTVSLCLSCSFAQDSKSDDKTDNTTLIETSKAKTNSPTATLAEAPLETNSVAVTKKPSKPAQKPDSKPDDKSSDDIQLSFQGANIDMVVQWLSQNTGKSVLKHPRVQCQLTIVSSKKMTKREALNLVYRALALEGFTAIESSKAILIVPEGQEPKMSPELLSASRNDIPEGREKLVKFFPLKHTQATDIREKIKGLLSEKANVDIDDRANQLIVTDYTENLSLVADMIAALDSDRPQDVSVRIIPVKNVSAQDLVKEVTPLYQKMATRNAKELIEISANDRSNSLIILSSEANFHSIEKIVAMLDTEDAQERVMRAFPLRNAEAGDVAKQLQDLYQDQDPNQRYPYYFINSSQNQSKNSKKMNVVADRRRNTVIVQAPPSVMENIEKMITTLDEPAGDETLAPRIYALKYVSAGDIEDILNELFLKRQQNRSYWNPFDGSQESSWADRDVGRLYGKVRITSEPHANALIISANSTENLSAVEAVIKQLDVPSEAGDTTLRVALNFSKAATVANNLNILFAKNGSLPVRGNNQQNQQNNQAIQQQQQQNQNNNTPSNFELEQDVKEEGYFPWLGGPQDQPNRGDTRAPRPVSDLVGRVRVVPDQRSNCLLISANVHFFPQVLKLIEELDVPTAEVLIEARIVEVTSDFLDKLGIRWSPDGSKVFTSDDFDNSFLIHGKGEYVKTFGAAVPAAIANSLHSGIIDSTMNLDFLIQFLRRTTDATVLAEPQINIADNEVGRLFVGQQVPFIDKSLSTDVGGLNQSFSYKNVGVILEVTPHINSTGDVALRVRTESSAIVPGQTLFGGAILDTRNFKTDLTAKDGETLVLGGIIQKQVSDTLRKTPILGEIPGLKWAFNKKDKTTRDVELMVFLRPKIVRTPEEAKALLREVDERAPRVKKWQDDAEPTTPKGKKAKAKS
jgi:general secretion pathway protein D